jgi:hypothetical protein
MIRKEKPEIVNADADEVIVRLSKKMVCRWVVEFASEEKGKNFEQSKPLFYIEWTGKMEPVIRPLRERKKRRIRR